MPVLYNQAEDPNCSVAESDSKQGGPLLPEHVAASERLTIADAYDPMNSIVVQFNPNELQRNVEVHEGELQPIGWSHPIRQYASTGAVKLDLKLWMSAWAARRHRNGPFAETPTEAVDNMLAQVGPSGKSLQGFDFLAYCLCWLESHCYAPAPGRAPAPVWLRWDYNLDMVATIDSCKSTVRIWDGEGKARIMEIDLSLTELRVGFRSSVNYHGQYERQDGGYKLSTTSGMRLTGTPYRPLK